ncbi:MAG: hypothetical protein WBV89_20780 [Ilumatobacter sp.]
MGQVPQRPRLSHELGRTVRQLADRTDFDYFYGFISGETDQFFPLLYRNTTAVEAPSRPEDGYQLTLDLADDCIAWIRQQKTIAPTVRFSRASGAAHGPHQPPLDWRGRNKGRFGMGWDEFRTQVHANQLEMGTIPEGAQLTERPEQIPSWDSQPPSTKRSSPAGRRTSLSRATYRPIEVMTTRAIWGSMAGSTCRRQPVRSEFECEPQS